MKVGDLVKLNICDELQQLDMFSSSSAKDLGIIIESHSHKKKSSGNKYNYFMVYWLDTNLRSTHGATSLVLATKEKNENR